MERQYTVKYSLDKGSFLKSLETADGMDDIVHGGWAYEMEIRSFCLTQYTLR
jgi:hypothetical protein